MHRKTNELFHVEPAGFSKAKNSPKPTGIGSLIQIGATIIVASFLRKKASAQKIHMKVRVSTIGRREAEVPYRLPGNLRHPGIHVL